MTTRRYGQHRAQQPMHLLFPFELVAHIATYLADDTGTLLACSITCRLWSNATRPQIFRDVTISSPHRLQALCDLIKGTPSIGSWIKKIIFAISRPRPCRDLLPTNWLIKTGEILRGLEKNLTRLRSIAFDSVEVGGDPADCTSFFEVLANFRTIRHVRVYECLLTVTSFCNFLCKLPLLESVSLEAPSPISLEGLVQGTGLIKISSLTLVFEWNQTKTRTWFTSAITAASLRNLVVDILEESYVGVTNRLLELTGPYLQTLDIMLPRYHESNAQSPSRLAIMEGINLRHNTVLRDITFYNPNAPEYIPILDQLSSPNLRRVFIMLTFSTLEEIKDYKDLDKRLGQQDFKHVEEVCVRYLSDSEMSVVSGEIHRVFSSVSARGILQVQKI